MGFIEKFNKQATITKLNKTPLYKEIEEHKNLLSDHKIDFKIKQEMDLFLYEVIYRSFYNEWRINRAWDEFRGEYYDTFNYINYEEKQKMFNNDLAPVLEELPHFYEKTSDLDIYLPQYEPEINRWFIKDYSLTTLKQH
ncbi:MAG TPA: hypothetical protein DHV77_03945, partial [Erysipelotrichaceae bacterium]|nr:hypothetical protein [Erysipelotrichaceae bacterium]